ncbi:MAG: hypothetical protein IJ736_00160 [Firmicutes bacterium]|nr:hypothetical protein [Bacillota bacterium]
MVYLIAVGGTGIRVMRSFLQMCMAGCFCGKSFKVICVDSDASNGDMKIYKDLAEHYSDFLNNFVNNDTSNFAKVYFHEAKTQKAGIKTYGIWSPLENPNDCLATILDRGAMQDAGDVFDFFYTSAEQRQGLDGGFYGHTSIGSLLMADAILENGAYNQEWANYFDLNGGGSRGDDKVFIIGSVFGGTGASGIPTIASIIRNTKGTEDMVIGTVFVMPYFNPGAAEADGGDGIDSINGEAFNPKLRSAMMFYKDQVFTDKDRPVFNVVYMVGSNDEMIVPNMTSGPEQRNKGSYMEILSAASVMDFLALDDYSFKVRFFNEEMSDVERLEFKDSDGKTVFDKLAEYLVFSIMYTKYFNRVFSDDCKVSGEWQKNLKKVINYEKIEGFAQERKIMAQCAYDYIEWMYEICMATKDTPGFDRGTFVKNTDNYEIKREFSESADNIFKAKAEAISKLYDPAYSIHGGISGFGIFKNSSYNLDKLEGISDLLVEEKMPETHLKMRTATDIAAILSNEGFEDYKSDFATITLMNAVKGTVWEDR